MGLRETINQKPALAGGVSAAIVILAILLVVWQMRGSSGRMPDAPLPADQAFFSDDDGQNFYADDVKNMPPYKHNGKDAVRAYVYKCGSGKPFVAYLQRVTPAGKTQGASTLLLGGRPAVGRVAIFEVKKPGKNNPWIPVDQTNWDKWQAVMTVNCPNPNDGPELLHPGQT